MSRPYVLISDGVVRPIALEDMSSYDPLWMTKIAPYTCPLNGLGAQVPPNPTHKPGTTLSAALAAFESSQPKVTTVTQPTQTSDSTVAFNVCAISQSPGENYISQWNTPANPASDNYTVNCTYVTSELITQAQLKTLKQRSTPATYTTAMTTLAATPSTTCPPNPTTGAPQTTCSTLKSTTEIGAYLRTWFGTLAPTVKDPVETTICANHPTFPECACMLRETDPNYTAIRDIQGLPEACWYTPCANSSDFLVPSTLMGATCPVTTCQTLTDYMSTHNITPQQPSNITICPDKPQVEYILPAPTVPTPAPTPAPRP